MGVDTDGFLPSGKGRRPPEPCCVWKLVICWLPRGCNSGSPYTIDNNKNKNNTSSWWQPFILGAEIFFQESQNLQIPNFSLFQLHRFGVSFSNGTSFWILLRDSKTKNKSRGFFTVCKITERLFGSTDSAVLRVGALRSSSRDTLNLRCGAPCSGLPMTILLSSASPLHSTPNPLILGWENNANEFCN